MLEITLLFIISLATLLCSVLLLKSKTILLSPLTRIIFVLLGTVGGMGTLIGFFGMLATIAKKG